MAHDPVEGIQPDLLKWARVSLGLSIADVANKLNKAEFEVEGWEKGIGGPTYPQLEKLAYQIYKRPLAIFFLPEPPEEVFPEQEFRSLPTSDMQNLLSDTYLRIRKGHAYQISLKEVFNNSNPATSKLWVECPLDINGSITNQAAKVRDSLGVSIVKQKSFKSDDGALKYWRASIEEHGIFVFKESFKQDDISGFCLSDPEFPLIYLNNSTTKTRQLFSLLHELAHILLSKKSLSKFDFSNMEELPEDQQKIEIFCNAIAAETILPDDEFEVSSSHLPYDIEEVSDYEISKIAAEFNVSREVVLRRFLNKNRISKEHYFKKAKLWSNQRTEKKSNGGDWFKTTNAYLSSKFAREVISQHYSQRISMEQASELLGINAKNFNGLEQEILRNSVA